MASIFALAVLVASLCPSAIWCYPTGAPGGTCDNMLPKHSGAVWQTSPNPYVITVSRNSVDGGGTLTVTIMGSNGRTFKGFIIKAVPESGSGSIGNFDDSAGDPDYKRLQCAPDQMSKEAATHTNNGPKEKVVLTWVAPTDYKGKVTFRGTVVEEFSKFWNSATKIQITVLENQIDSIPAFSQPTHSQPFQPTRNTPLQGGTAPGSVMFDYAVCGKTKGCFGHPRQCIGMKNCEMLVTFSPSLDNDNMFDFQLISRSQGYVAVGLSMDQYMGGDAVANCQVDSRSGVTAYSSYNRGKTNNGQTVMDTNMFKSGRHANGVIDCTFLQKGVLFVNPMNRTFNMNSSPYYLLLVKGDVSKGLMMQHDTIAVSSQMVKMTDLIIVDGKNVDLEIIIHGALMVVAWVGTVSIAVFLARYYKEMWPERMHCGVKIWFAWHRALNALTVILTLAAFILIFVYLNKFSEVWETNPHPILGCITTGLMVLQPIGALCRPHPGTPRRSIFNWLHYLGGMLACACGIITLFFAVKLQNAGLPECFWWILIAFVAFYVVMFCVMEFFTCLSGRKSDKEVIPMKDYSAQNGSLRTSNSMIMEPQGAKFKQVMLWLFIVGCVGFAAALVVVIVI